MNFPTDLQYTDHDEWVQIQEGEVVCGISDYAQDQLSDIVYVELPEVGDRFQKDEPYGVVESVKAASDVYMPVTGEIVAVNEDLEDTPEVVNQDPYGKGWFVRTRPDDLAELEELLDADAYRQKVKANG